MSSTTTSSEYRHFEYAAKLKHVAQIKLCTRIFNRDAARNNKDQLSVVYATTDHQVFAYGSNDSGCLGLASVRQHFAVPAPIKELAGKGLAKLASGNCFVIALTESGQVYSWGDNRFGQLGLGKSVASVNRPALIDSGLKGEHIVDISCGQFHVLLLTADHHLYAFGSNVSGAIGNGTTFHQSRPVHLTNLAAEVNHLGVDTVAISAGGWHSACLNLKGELFVWGWNEQGQCGLGAVEGATSKTTTTSKQVHPQRVLLPTLDPNSFPCVHAVITSVHCGLHHTLALTFEGLVYAWGSNEYGECAQDPTTVKACPRAVPVNLEDRVLEIVALSKSRLSLARSQLHYYVWGQQSSKRGQTTPINNFQPHIPRKFTISQQVTSSLSFNLMLAKHEAHQFSLEVNTNQQSFSSSTALVIADSSSGVRASNGKLNFTFNNPTESDVVFLFGNSKNPRTIFVQKTVLETVHHHFLKDFSGSKFCQVPEEHSEQLKPLEQTISLTINRNKLKFSQLTVVGVSFGALYAYLFFFYSNYLVISPDQLIKVMALCESLNNEHLLGLCLQFIEANFSLAQLCDLYRCALREGLLKVVHFCADQARELLQDGETRSQLYSCRQRADLSLTCLDAQNGRQYSTLAHRLVLRVKCRQLYQALVVKPTAKLSNSLSSKLSPLNSATSDQDELLLSDSLNFGTLFSPASLELFVRFVYCQDLVTSETGKHSTVSVPVLIELTKVSKLIREPHLEAICLEQLERSITPENVCSLYVTYVSRSDQVDPENAFLVDMFIRVIKENWDAFAVSDDFRSLLVNRDEVVFNLILNYSNFSLKM